MATWCKHDAFKFKSKDYVIDKEDQELLPFTITKVPPLLMKTSQPTVLEIWVLQIKYWWQSWNAWNLHE